MARDRLRRKTNTDAKLEKATRRVECVESGGVGGAGRGAEEDSQTEFLNLDSRKCALAHSVHRVGYHGLGFACAKLEEAMTHPTNIHNSWVMDLLR